MGSTVRSLVVLLGCFAAACGQASIGGGAGSGGGAGGPDAGTGGGGFIDASGGGGGNEFADAMADANCGVQEEEIEVVNTVAPPDLLIVLDRSGSMGDPLELFDFFGPTKWDVMRDALKQITTTHNENIRFGLSVFPTSNTCDVSAGTAVSIGDMTAASIAQWLDSNSADGGTPAQLALQQALATYQSIPVNDNGRYVLYATDGSPNCDDNGPPAEEAVISAIEALRTAGINTFVIGYAGGFGTNNSHLIAAAEAGGVPRPGGNPSYYLADSAADLQAALEAISGDIIEVSCEYELTALPPEPDSVTVTIDGVPVPQSTTHTNGWDYAPDASHITFFGSYCDQIQSGASGSVRFSYGCPGPVVD